MTLDALIGLAILLVASTWTPGPNNAMLASSGATFGYRRTVPHALGVALGFPAMLFLVAMGLGKVFKHSVLMQEALRYGGAVLMLWVAYKIATAKAPGSPGSRSKPFTFLQAAAFQWVNPKAWVMCVGVVAQFMTGENTLAEAATATGVAITSGLGSANGWALFGAALQRFLRTEGRLRAFNLTMAVMIVVGIFFLLTGDLNPA
ncbi:LysE family translocator [Halovulum sp. GXIMD14793]